MSRIGIYSVNSGLNVKNAIFEKPIYGIGRYAGLDETRIEKMIEALESVRGGI